METIVGEAVLEEVSRTLTSRTAQTGLKRLGHYAGRIDGIFGPLSMSAFQAFAPDDSMVTVSPDKRSVQISPAALATRLQSAASSNGTPRSPSRTQQPSTELAPSSDWQESLKKWLPWIAGGAVVVGGYWYFTKGRRRGSR